MVMQLVRKSQLFQRDIQATAFEKFGIHIEAEVNVY
jgi:hypothetical protein